MTRFLAISLVCGSALACLFRATSRTPKAVADVAGCYDVTVGTWSGPFPSGVPEASQAPRTIRLLAKTHPQRPGYYRAEPELPLLRGVVPSGYHARPQFPPEWQIANDTLIIGSSDGYVGLTLHTSIGGDTLRGYARAGQHVMGPQPTAPAVLVRAHC